MADQDGGTVEEQMGFFKIKVLTGSARLSLGETDSPVKIIFHAMSLLTLQKVILYTVVTALNSVEGGGTPVLLEYSCFS